MQIIVPKRYVGITPYDIVIFLAGPVLGGGDWQRYVIQHFMSVSVHFWPDSYRNGILPRIKFVVPCRWDARHPLSGSFATQYSSIEEAGVVEAGQTAWEVFYLLHILRRKIAEKRNGFVFFGLFPESKEQPRTDGVPYATDTRVELGRYGMLAKYEGTTDSLFIGAHPEFPIGALKSNSLLFSGEEWVSNNMTKIITPVELADWIAQSIRRDF